MQTTPTRRRKLLFEPLEPRLLLDASPLSFTAASAAALILHLEDASGTPTLRLLDANGAVQAERALAETSAVNITGSSGDDQLTVDATVPNALPINFVGGGGSDTLIGPQVDSTWQITGADAGVVGNVAFSGVENLQGAADNEDTFVFEAAGTISGLIDGGAGGFDTLVIDGGSFRHVAFTTTGPNSGTVARDGNVISYAGLEPIGDTTTGADRHYSGMGGAETITISDTGTSSDGSFQITSSSGEGVQFVAMAGSISTLTIDALGDNDGVNFVSIDSLFTGTITIHVARSRRRVAHHRHRCRRLPGDGRSKGDIRRFREPRRRCDCCGRLRVRQRRRS